MIIEQELYEQISNLTETDYEGWLNKDREEFFITTEKTLNMLRDLVWEVEHWKEQYEDLKEDVESNYEHKKIDPYDYYGISRNAFIDKTIL